MKEPFVSEALGTEDDLPRCLKDKVLYPVSRTGHQKYYFVWESGLKDCDCTKFKKHLLMEKG